MLKHLILFFSQYKSSFHENGNMSSNKQQDSQTSEILWFEFMGEDLAPQAFLKIESKNFLKFQNSCYFV